MTDTLELGSMCWSHVRKGADARHVGGMVVDVGVADDTTPYVVVLDENVVTPVKAWKLRNRVVARRIMLADVDEALTQPPEWYRMVGGARGALLTVGCGSGGFRVDEKELCYWGAALLEAATK